MSELIRVFFIWIFIWVMLFVIVIVLAVSVIGSWIFFPGLAKAVAWIMFFSIFGWIWVRSSGVYQALEQEKRRLEAIKRTYK